MACALEGARKGTEVLYCVSLGLVTEASVTRAVYSLARPEQVRCVEFFLKTLVDPMKTVYRIEVIDKGAAETLLSRSVDGHHFVSSWEKEVSIATSGRVRVGNIAFC